MTSERSTTDYPVTKSDQEWRAELTPAEYAVLRKAGTERPHVGEYTDTRTVGVYECRACGSEIRADATRCRWCMKAA